MGEIFVFFLRSVFWHSVFWRFGFLFANVMCCRVHVRDVSGCFRLRNHDDLSVADRRLLTYRALLLIL